MRRILPFFVLLLSQLSHAQEKITIKTLLDEMYDRSSLAEWPRQEYLCKQSSSYDRSSKVKKPEDGIVEGEIPGKYHGKPGWFGNGDQSNYCHTITRNGHQEDVMLDVEGSGVVTRIWQTHSEGSYKASGILRIYIDDNETPALEVIGRNVIGKPGLVPYPFSFCAPELTENPWWRGRNLMFPIPYKKSCRITWDGHKMYGSIGGWAGNYYQINYREYTSPVNIESFSYEALKKYGKDIKAMAKKLREKNTALEGDSFFIKPGKKYELNIRKPGAIDRLQMRIGCANMEQALRSTVLELSFDNEKTVWIPVGQFYGIGYKMAPHKTHYIEVGKDRLMTSRWVMPFKKIAKITLHNYSDEAVVIDRFAFNVRNYKWNKNSMYFHATWREEYKSKGDVRKDGDFVTVQGKGVYVGDNLTIFNSGPDWWGEGDEKIFVDGEDFPSHFGTGTEDYYCYAWCRPHPFSLPFVSQPIGEGNKTWGMTSNNRYRHLDAIPFKKSLNFDMEIFHPFCMPLNWSPATFFYALPGAVCDVKPDIEGVKRPVTLTLEQMLDGFPQQYKKMKQKKGFPIIFGRKD
ncbi:MAG: DUF2961 domain-containing protein [Cytophagales bacterium]|nr:DUF2961 domain-containing protein [Cytophagales bacterium]